ncbi:hypothetical protein M3Y95_00978100 [Aphelenchoides besseyi]|nr:hypothetical protein M3Y95_00978100 [Aphelenchoides besseyi]
MLLSMSVQTVMSADEPADMISDPCHFPAPHFANFKAQCQLQYHRVGFVCDPMAVLSRTEAELLNRQFSKYRLNGCVDCDTSPRSSYCVSKKTSNYRISILIVPYANVQRIESCVGGRFGYSRMAPRDAAREFAAAVTQNWSQSGCSVDLTILYLGTLHSSVQLAQPGPFVVRMFTNRLVEFSQLGTVGIVNEDARPFDVLYSVLNQSLSDARIDNEQETFPPKDNHIGGVPPWAFQLCALLLLLVAITAYIGRCVTKRFDLRAQQKKYNSNRSNAHNVNSSALTAAGSSSLLNSGTGGSSAPTTLMGNMALQSTKSSMMFRQFSNNNAKKQKARAAASLQQI